MDEVSDEVRVIILELLDYEPNWKTHHMSVWNRARRLLEPNTSDAMSWNPDTQEWEL